MSTAKKFSAKLYCRAVKELATLDTNKCGTLDGNCNQLNACPICFEDIVAQDIGFPERCSHQYCFKCLLAWTTKESTREKTCPLDRIPYNQIIVKSPLDFKEQQHSCVVCLCKDQQAHIMFCNRCHWGHHLLCMFPALNKVPDHSWLCPTCQSHQEPVESEPEPSVAAPVLRRSARILAQKLNSNSQPSSRQRKRNTR